ncbi:MAG: hypothetical protein V4563_17340 [Pseudomonadota bacterium]
MGKRKPIRVPEKFNTRIGHAPAYLTGVVDTAILFHELTKKGASIADFVQLANDILQDAVNEEERLRG